MQSKSITLGVLLLATIGAAAQKVDLDKFNYQESFTSLPQKPLGSEFTTQRVNVNTASSVKDGISEGEMVNNVNVEGFKKITEKAHLNVDVYFDDLMIERTDVNERTEEVKDKNGKVTGKNYYYKVVAVYSFSGRASAMDFKGNNLGNWTLHERGDKRNWESNEYATRKAAADYFNDNKYAIRNELVRKEAVAGLKTLNGYLNTNYGFVPRKEYNILWMLDSKKHPEYEAQKTAWTSFKEVVNTITPNEIPQAAKDKLLEIVKYFDGVKTKYATDEKTDKKMRYSSFYNNAKIYLILEMPEQAIKEAEGLIANDFDPKDGKRLKEEAEAMIKSFKLNNTTTCHFKIDLSKAEGPK